MDGRVAAEDPIALIVESWCSPTLVSPAGRPCSVMQLGQQQAAGPVELEIGDPYLEDEQWDMEAMVRAPPRRSKLARVKAPAVHLFVSPGVPLLRQ